MTRTTRCRSASQASSTSSPCVIAGYSIGCVIAYEVGLRMVERGRPVRMLLLFDGFAPRRKRRKTTRRARARFHLERFRRALWEDPASAEPAHRVLRTSAHGRPDAGPQSAAVQVKRIRERSDVVGAGHGSHHEL